MARSCSLLRAALRQQPFELALGEPSRAHFGERPDDPPHHVLQERVGLDIERRQLAPASARSPNDAADRDRALGLGWCCERREVVLPGRCRAACAIAADVRRCPDVPDGPWRWSAGRWRSQVQRVAVPAARRLSARGSKVQGDFGCCADAEPLRAKARWPRGLRLPPSACSPSRMTRPGPWRALRRPSGPPSPPV